MIILPTSPAPNGATPELLDFGMILRPATGAPAQYFTRPGSRFQVQFAFPPMAPETARVFVSRLLLAKRDGLRMPYPLLGINQGNPGAPLVNGGTSAGTSLLLKGLTPGYLIKEGFWLTVIDAAGVHYLHNVRALVAADSAGLATVTIEPPLRTVLANNNAVLLGRPLVEGIVTSVVNWPLPVNKLIDLGFTLEEAA